MFLALGLICECQTAVGGLRKKKLTSARWQMCPAKSTCQRRGALLSGTFCRSDKDRKEKRPKPVLLVTTSALQGHHAGTEHTPPCNLFYEPLLPYILDFSLPPVGPGLVLAILLHPMCQPRVYLVTNGSLFCISHSQAIALHPKVVSNNGNTSGVGVAFFAGKGIFSIYRASPAHSLPRPRISSFGHV